LVGRPEEKRSLVRPRNKWKDSITMAVIKSGMKRLELDWSGSKYEQVAGKREYDKKFSGSIKCGFFWG
jgi:hypothetical protein